MEKQLSKNQEQEDQGNEVEATVDEFGRTVLSVSQEELRARIDQLRRSDTADPEE